jgi:hypothetical protein
MNLRAPEVQFITEKKTVEEIISQAIDRPDHRAAVQPTNSQGWQIPIPMMGVRCRLEAQIFARRLGKLQASRLRGHERGKASLLALKCGDSPAVSRWIGVSLRRPVFQRSEASRAEPKGTPF